MLESITDPLTRVGALISVAKALPASERGRKQALLERAITLLRDRLQQANPGRRSCTSRRSRSNGSTWASAIVPGASSRRGRLRTTLSRQGFWANWRGSSRSRLSRDCRTYPIGLLPPRNGLLAEVAVQLATEHPAQAEQVFNLREDRGEQNHIVFTELRLCRRLARVDPPRARRVAATLVGTGTRACAWASVAVGLAEKDKAGAAEAMDRAIHEIDRLRESGPGPEPVSITNGIRLMAPTNPAALILPIVERIAPERLAEVFWRAVALHPRIEPDREDLLQTSYIGYECTLLARYDREVAAALSSQWMLTSTTWRRERVRSLDLFPRPSWPRAASTPATPSRSSSR